MRRQFDRSGTEYHTLRQISSWLTEELRDRIQPEYFETAKSIALGDLINYLKSYWGIVGRENVHQELMKKISFFSSHEPEETKQFISFWVRAWLKKWEKRVKILDEDQELPLESEFEGKNQKDKIWQSLNKKSEMIDLVVQAMIKNGEICATSLIAKNLIRAEIRRYLELYDLEGQDGVNKIEENLLNIVNRVVAKIRSLRSREGPLIYLKRKMR
jgi:hypothetical protein